MPKKYISHDPNILLALNECLDTELSYFRFDIYKCYQARLISFINGAIYCLEHQTELNQEKKSNLIGELQDLTQKKIAEIEKYRAVMSYSPVNFSAELYHFYTEELPKISGLTSKQIALAEAFYVWQDLERPTRKTHYHRALENGDKLMIEQIDDPLSTPLTDSQKKELCRVHSSHNHEHPQWFKDLDSWARQALLKIIPSNLDGDWREYERCKPSTLRYIPGQANSTLHTLKLSISDNVILTTKALRQGTPTSFGMRNSQDRQKSATDNLAQMLNHDQIAQAKEDFKKIWQNTDIEMPILLGGLVTPAEQAGLLGKILDYIGASGDENNTKLAHEKEKALHLLTKQTHKMNVRFFNLNVGINVLSKQVNPDPSFIQYTEEFHRKFSQLSPHVDASINQERIFRLKILADAIDKLKKLGAKNKSQRNRNLYLAALYDVTVRMMNGLSTGNCKSSKDRKGTELMAADAMLIYAQEQALLGEQPSLPAYEAQGKDREHYINIFTEIYASGHQCFIAHDNSPGSPGIKDEGFMDKDVIEKLHTMRKPDEKDKSQSIFALSKQVASFNNPGTFWQKFGPRVKRYATAAGIALIAGISIALMATGILSPLGIIGVALAAKLGTAALIIGGIANIATGCAAVAILTGLVTSAKNYIETLNQKKNSFKKQMERILSSGHTKGSNILIKPGSTLKVMFKCKQRKPQIHVDNQLTNPLIQDDDEADRFPLFSPSSLFKSKGNHKNNASSEIEPLQDGTIIRNFHKSPYLGDL